MALISFLQNNPLAFLGLVAVVSLAVGSFLNVVIYRLPIMMEQAWRAGWEEFKAEESPHQQSADSVPVEQQGDKITEAYAEEHPGTATEKSSEAPAGSPPREPFNLARPRSRCPGCGAAICAWQNIPVISYVLLGGKCGSCGATISIRYPLIEVLTMLLSLVVAWHFGPTPEAVLAMIVTWYFVVMSMIDFDHQLLPDALTLPLMWIGLLSAALAPVFTDLHSAVIGAASGYGVLWLVFHAFRLITGKEGMGYGDFKLLAAIGALLGWQALPMVILFSSLVGAILGIAIVATTGRDRHIPLPFGPYLAAAGWITMIWGEPLTQWYFGTLG